MSIHAEPRSAPSAPALPSGRPLTLRDLDDLPNDGHRYELIDGVLIVSPSPFPPHQIMVGHLYSLLAGACDPEHFAFVAPFDVPVSDTTLLQPDVLVMRASDVHRRGIRTVPRVAIEVVSPSSRTVDRFLKLAAYAEAGVPWCWIADPSDPSDPTTASVVVHELVDGVYQPVATVEGHDAVLVSKPFEVRVCPADLLAFPGSLADD